MIVLGIETSCDETAVALVNDARDVLAHELFSQIDEHASYGGVVPEIAARAHLLRLDVLIDRALDIAGCKLSALDAIAATAGPGLIGGLMVGTMTAKAIACVHDKPFIAVNHLEAHALTARFTDHVAFPYLLMLVSGGHAQILVVEGVGNYKRLGATIDDAVGECFDKVAKMLGLGIPGGPAVEKLAENGDPRRFDLPRPIINQSNINLSFSGLKTAVRQLVLRLGPDPLDRRTAADICASFQAAVADCLIDRLNRAISIFKRDYEPGPIVVAGGVAANQVIRERIGQLAAERGVELAIPPASLCTDNGVMVAWAGIERLKLGLIDDLSAKTQPRWPLDPDGPALPGAGVKA